MASSKPMGSRKKAPFANIPHHIMESENYKKLGAWEVKLLLPLLFAANAFLKFVWSNRLFGYCSVMMGAVPNDASDLAYARAAKAAEINIFAAKSYNRGLRTVYFGIASTAWLIGPEALLAAAVVTLVMILRREFASQSREVLLQSEPEG